MTKDIPILLVKNEKNDCYMKQYTNKVTNGDGQLHLLSFYRKVKTFLLNQHNHEKLYLEFSPSLIHSSVDVEEINNTLSLISQLYNESNYFINLTYKMPVNIFLNFARDRTDRALLRLYNFTTYEKKSIDLIKKEFDKEIYSYGSGEVFRFDNADEATDMLLYFKLKYQNICFEHKIYSIKDKIIHVEK